MKSNIYRLLIGFSLILLWIFLFLIKTPSERERLGPTAVIILFCCLVAGVYQIGLVLKSTLGKKMDDLLSSEGKSRRKKAAVEWKEFTSIESGDELCNSIKDASDKAINAMKKNKVGISEGKRISRKDIELGGGIGEPAVNPDI